MKSFFLVETTTREKLIHQGIFFKPKRPGKKALLWIHGLTDKFYGDRPLIDTLVEKCEENGFGFAAFNNRGHDFLASVHKIDHRKVSGYTHKTVGSSIEEFKDSLYDIEAGIDFLVRQGFTEVVPIGHSTGANKVCYFAATVKNPHLQGVVLASPVSDRLDPSMSKSKLVKDLIHMEDLITQGKGDVLHTGYHFFPLTPNRFKSLFSPNSLEDQFDYGDPRPRMKYFSQIKKPLLVVLSGKDEYADRAPGKIKAVFDAYQRSTNYKSVIINGARHSYDRNEKVVVNEIVRWIQSIP